MAVHDKSNPAAPVTALPDLVILRAVSNGALKNEKLPARIKIFAWGDNPSIKGNFAVGNKSAAVLSASQRTLGFERVALDYNHCSVPGTPEYEKLLKAGQPPIIFGYGRPNVVPGDGVYLEEMEYTPLGVQSARNFEDLSPAAAARCGEVDFIHSVALTTNGCLEGVTFFSASTKGSQTTDPMSDNNKNTVPLTLALLASALGLAADAAEADVTKEIKTLSALKPLSALIKDNKVVVVDTEAFTGLTNRVKAIEDADFGKRVKAVEDAGTKNVALLSATVDGKTVTFTAEDVVKLTARVGKLETDLANAAKADQESEAGQIIALLSAEGKAPVNPQTKKPYTGEELKKLDVPTLNILALNTPATVPLSARNKAVTENTGLDPKLKGRSKLEAAIEAQLKK